MEHAGLDALIDRSVTDAPVDDFTLHRLKKRCFILRDAMVPLKRLLYPTEPA